MQPTEFLRPSVLSASASAGVPSLPSSPFTRTLSSPPQLGILKTHYVPEPAQVESRSAFRRPDPPFNFDIPPEEDRPILLFPRGLSPQKIFFSPSSPPALSSPFTEVVFKTKVSPESVPNQDSFSPFDALSDPFNSISNGDPGFQEFLRAPNSRCDQGSDPSEFLLDPVDHVPPPLLRDAQVHDDAQSSQGVSIGDSTDRYLKESAPTLSGGRGGAKAVRRIKKTRPAYEIEGRLPRPPNSWILYRSEKITQMKSLESENGLAQSVLSKKIASQWRDEPMEVKRSYAQRAEIIKAEHAIKYPEYKYNPKRSKKTSDQKKKPNSVHPSEEDIKIGDQHNTRNDEVHTLPAQVSLSHQRGPLPMNGMEKTGSAMVLHQFYEHFPAIGQLLGGQDISPHQSTFNPASLSYTSPGFQTQQSWPSEAAEGPSVFGWPPPVPTNVPMSWDPTWSDTQAEPRTAYSEPRSSVWGSIGSGAPSHTLHQSIRSERESRSAFPSLGPSSHLYPLPIYNPSLSGGSNPGNLLPDHMNNTNWQENQTSWSNHTFAPWPSTFLGPTSSQPNSSGTGDPPTYLNEESQIQGNPFTWPSGSSQM